MNKSFATMKTNVGRNIGDTSSTTATILGGFINDAYRQVADRYDWDELFYTQSVTSTANVSSISLENVTGRLMWVLDKNNDNYVQIIDEQTFDQEYYNVWDTTGTPSVCFITYNPTKVDASAAMAPMVKSSSASDVTQTVTIRGIASNVETYESLSLSGTTFATATNSFSKILMMSKSASAVGTVSVYDNDGSTVISQMAPKILESRYLRLNLHYIPSSAIGYQLRTRRWVAPMIDDNDYATINDVSEAIELKATAIALRYKRKYSQAQYYDTLFEKELSERIHFRVDQPSLVRQMTPTPLNRDDGIL